ncbi:hypothetical protein BFP72_06610 [Reichenbachiella sp. 5M10]|uniref:protein kinase domain-containing protein n=1 Tax=Reichenbachiella sp. 5M10 TaxID=1889772 RepID=UPI000C5B4B0A|nr:protein kinase [Reichenbachiella sp. 5M10]PIB35092.1 hypothetical protein BFP72_06610 [Reichenbachiella sp. 5M10]
MYDLRDVKNINLEGATCLKEDTAYKFIDQTTGKTLVAKFISGYSEQEDEHLIAEFKKLVLLSGQPEIATAYSIRKAEVEGLVKPCYIMDWVDGQSLQTFMNKREKLIYEVVLDVILQLSSGLEKSHSHEIHHGDLHNENIIIDQNGYLKIIDFLWFDSKKDPALNSQSDIQNFMRIVNELYEKCDDVDKRRLSLIRKHCQQITTFKGLKKEIQLLDEISFDFALLDDKPLTTPLTLFKNMDGIHNLRNPIQTRDLEIPNKVIPEFNEQELDYLEKQKNPNQSGITLRHLDTLIDRIKANAHQLLSSKLYPLEQIGLIDWQITINNPGDMFTGRYDLNFDIWFTSKFFKWKRVFELLPLLKFDDVDLNSYLLDE